MRDDIDDLLIKGMRPDLKTDIKEPLNKDDNADEKEKVCNMEHR